MSAITNLVVSGIRTVVPYLVGLLASWLITLGVDVPAEVEGALIQVGTFVLGTLYYLVVRIVEEKVPGIGVLLGATKKPVYDAVRGEDGTFRVAEGQPVRVETNVIEPRAVAEALAEELDKRGKLS